jgi:hypothetical protein
LLARADAIVDAFTTARTSLDAQIALADTADADALRSALMSLSYAGIPGAVPAAAVASGGDAAVVALLTAQAVAVSLRAAAIADQLTTDATAFDRGTATVDEAVAYDVTRIQRVLGRSIPVLPRLAPEAAAGLSPTFGDATLLDGAPAMAVPTWLQRAARVRDGARRLDDALFYAETVGGDSVAGLTVGQLAAEAGERWIGLPTADGGLPPAGRAGVVAHTPVAVDLTLAVAGLAVDAWVDVVPATTETAGVAFHYDQPNSRAPQTILLAVPADDRAAWDVDAVEAVVLEAIALSNIRLVDPDALAGLGQLLPATFVATNVAGDTIATDLTRAAVAVNITEVR